MVYSIGLAGMIGLMAMSAGMQPLNRRDLPRKIKAPAPGKRAKQKAARKARKKNRG